MSLKLLFNHPLPQFSHKVTQTLLQPPNASVLSQGHPNASSTTMPQFSHKVTQTLLQLPCLSLVTRSPKRFFNHLGSVWSQGHPNASSTTLPQSGHKVTQTLLQPPCLSLVTLCPITGVRVSVNTSHLTRQAVLQHDIDVVFTFEPMMIKGSLKIVQHVINVVIL